MIKLIYTFYKGLVDSTAVIQYGRNVKNRERNIELYQRFSTKKGLLYLPILLFKEVIKKRVKKINFSFSEVIYAGHTKNNLKEFECFHNWCNGILDDKDAAQNINNIVNADNIGFFKRKDKSIIINAILSVVIFISFFTNKITLNQTSLTYALEYTRNFLIYYKAMKSQKGCLPTLLVVSNDHNPNYVAVSRVFKLFGVKRIYLQHAAVSKIFPKLDFDYAVLMNENSQQTYNKIGKSKAQVFTISRLDNSFKLEDKKYETDEMLNVCLLPTSIPSLSHLNKIIEELDKNIYINNIFIKHHPRFNEVDKINRKALVVNSLDTISNHRLICIAGNTTAALDYALQGEEVYQCFAMDDIPEDYYGFVHKKICKTLKVNELSSTFWLPNFKAPVDRLKEYCPHLAGTHEYSLQQLRDSIAIEMKDSIRLNKEVLSEKSTKFKAINNEIITMLGSMSIKNRCAVIHAMKESEAISSDEHIILNYLLNKS
ncbi:hypothetical protein ACQKPX_14125 [Photobacterium sp. DNB23_23_1]